MNAEQIKTEVKLMKAWCEENYSNGADTMVECWTDEDYAKLFEDTDCAEGAWRTLKDVAEVFAERQADAAYYRENW